ncbi:MAG TPA: ABC transporter permease, partial [Ilumatobacteraceae bacterium]|nr:ABC transporter permease [Ilumatobacteraceae bacterium]
MSLRSAVAHRNLLYLLSLKELRTRYKKSILGWTWSLLNPLTQMLIFSIIFLFVFRQPPPVGDPSGLKNFPLYFLCGLLPFNFFAISVSVSMGNVQGGAGLIKKVQFPHEHLVFSVVVAQFVTMLIEFLVLTTALLIAGNMVLPWIPVLLIILMLLAMFTTGVALALSAANVFFHDINYLWTIVSQLLFYATPIIYDANNPNIPRLLQLIAAHGPTGSFISAVRDVMYNLRM